MREMREPRLNMTSFFQLRDPSKLAPLRESTLIITSRVPPGEGKFSAGLRLSTITVFSSELHVVRRSNVWRCGRVGSLGLDPYERHIRCMLL